VNDALLKGLTERSAERRCARLRFEWQRLTCIRSLYFKLGSMANASIRTRQSRAQVSLAAARCAATLRHWYQALDLCAPVSLNSRSKAAVAGEGIVRVTVSMTSKSKQNRAHTQAEATRDGEAASDRMPPNV